MSTGLYLKCLSHDKPIQSDELNTKDAASLKAIRELVTSRDTIVASFNAIKDHVTLDGFNRGSWIVAFLVEHPTCEIGLFDGYGGRYRIDTDSYTPDWTEAAVAVESEKLIHMAGFVGGYAVPRCLSSMVLRRDDMSHEVTCPECVVEAKRLGIYNP
jgi:hypothetical protein